MAAWFTDFLLLLCVAYFKSLLGGRKFLEHLCNSQMLRFCSDSLGTRAISNVSTSEIGKYM